VAGVCLLASWGFVGPVRVATDRRADV